MIILIPSYEPNMKFIKLIQELKEKCDYNILVVDDGSGEDCRCTVLTHVVNKGKGEALKTGFRYIQEIGENEGIITADCDGQHLPGRKRGQV